MAWWNMDPKGEMKREASDQDTVFLHFNLLQYYTLHNTAKGKLVKEACGNDIKE